MKRFLSAVLLFSVLLCNVSRGEEEADLRVEYQDFISSYSENIIFINQNTGRSLIPLVFSSGETENELRVYRLYGEVLSATVKTKGTSRGIVWCQIKLTAPENMSYGDDTYKSFVTSGYHSYALLMSMHRSDDAQVRYALVSAVNDALSKGDSYETTVGDYKLLCLRNGNTVTLNFGWHEWEPLVEAGNEATEEGESEPEETTIEDDAEG